MTSEFEAKLGPWMQSVPVSPAALAHLRDLELPVRRQRRWWPRLLPATASALVAVAVVVALWSALVLRPSLAAVPPDPRAFAGDPRLARCVNGGPEPLAAFAMAHASDYRLHLPAMGLSPELDRPDPAFVVVLGAGTAPGGGGGLPASNGPSGGSPGPNGHDVCVLVGADPATADRLVYTNVDTTGLRADLSPAPTSTATDVPVTTSESPAAFGPAIVVTQDGLTLTVRPPAIVVPGTPAIFSIELRNDRAVAADLADVNCFGGLVITAPLPPDQAPSSLTGAKAQFRSWLLAHAYGPGGVPALAPIALDVITPCTPSSNTSLAPGATLHTTDSWPGYYARGFFVPPGSVSFSINVDYDRQNNPPTLAPHFTGIPPNTIVVYKHLTLTGQVQVAAHNPVAVGPGKAADAAISDQRFWSFASKQPTSACGANLFPTEANGVSLPAGPIWEVDYFCNSPRRFALAAVDAYTGQVTGVDLCTDPCNR